MKSELYPSRPAATAKPLLVAPTTSIPAGEPTVPSLAPISLCAAILAGPAGPTASASAGMGADHG